MRGPQPHENEIAGLDELHFLHKNHCRRPLLDTLVGESRVVAHAGKTDRGASHGLDVEGVLDPPDEGFTEGGSTPGDLVEVRASRGVVASVEAGVGATGGKDVDVGRQQVVETVKDSLLGKGLLRLQVGDLPDSMHPGIGTPGSLELDWPAEGLSGRLQQFALDGTGILLPLPPVVARSLILDRETITHEP